eukprot:scaffold124137_cov33-Tisochrysis_lutea.AAC.6
MPPSSALALSERGPNRRRGAAVSGPSEACDNAGRGPAVPGTPLAHAASRSARKRCAALRAIASAPSPPCPLGGTRSSTLCSSAARGSICASRCAARGPAPARMAGSGVGRSRSSVHCAFDTHHTSSPTASHGPRRAQSWRGTEAPIG